MVKKKIIGIGVDSGMIMLGDVRSFGRAYSIPRSHVGWIRLPVGKYGVEWKIPNTYNGTVAGRGTLKVTSGDVIIGDPCYYIKRDAWGAFVNKIYPKATSIGRIPVPGTVVMDKMGGDGQYTVYLQMTKKV